MRFPYLLAIAALAMASCDRTPELTPAPRPSAAPSAIASTAAQATAGPSAKKPGEGRRRGGRDPLVYLDGALVGALRRAELPPSFEPTMVVRGKPFPIFALAGYLEAVGADIEAIREVHLAGGRRVAVLSGKELRRARGQLHFAFTKRNHGKARMDWPDAPIDISTRIDVISAVYVYQRREPPEYDRKTGSFHFGDGAAIEGVPHADHPRAQRGTRLYLDGRLHRVLRKRDAGESASLETLVQPKSPIRGVDLVARDETVIHRSGDAWREGLKWSLEDGRLSVRIEQPQGERTTELAAVQVYTKVRPKP